MLDHPLDQYFKSKFQKEKNKKLGKDLNLKLYTFSIAILDKS
jgi:hypothetical protein